MKIFLICPVRDVHAENLESIRAYVAGLERQGRSVHWPARDTDQADPIGLRICEDNRAALETADEVHVWYDSKSIGSVFDLGMAFALRKRMVLANPAAVTSTPHKSFANVLLRLSGLSRHETKTAP